MILLHNDGNTICLHCGGINTISEDIATCRSCGEADRWEFRKAFEALGSECVEYGILYRNMYERDLAAGGCNVRYALPGFDQLMIFAGISAASGIIGGVAYDLVKGVITKIANSAPIDMEMQNDPFRIQFLQKEENINIFIERIAVYLDGMRDVHPDVKSAIVEELVVHEMGRMMEKSQFNASGLLTDKKNLRSSTRKHSEMSLNARSSAQAKNIGNRCGSFTNFWSKKTQESYRQLLPFEMTFLTKTLQCCVKPATGDRH